MHIQNLYITQLYGMSECLKQGMIPILPEPLYSIQILIRVVIKI